MNDRDRERLAAVTAELNRRLPNAIGDYLELLQRAHDTLSAVNRAEDALKSFSDRPRRAVLQEYEDLRDGIDPSSPPEGA